MSSVVVGIISFTVHRDHISIDKLSFIRDVIFFIVSLLCILVITMFGRINLWGALSFISLYFVYVLFVSTTEFWGKNRRAQQVEGSICNNILPISIGQNCSELDSPLLGSISGEKRPNLINHEKVNIGEIGGKRGISNLKYWEKVVVVLQLPLSLPKEVNHTSDK